MTTPYRPNTVARKATHGRRAVRVALAAALLANIDRLDAAAPADLKSDMNDFDRFEHATLDPSGGGSPDGLVGGRIHAALTHVADYLRDDCHI